MVDNKLRENDLNDISYYNSNNIISIDYHHYLVLEKK